MLVRTRESFAGIWRQVFVDAAPSEAEVAEAWARTRELFAEQYGRTLTQGQMGDLLAEMAVAWLLRALSPNVSALDTELASLAQQAALWLGVLRCDLDRVYDGYFHLLQAWGVYR